MKEISWVKYFLKNKAYINTFRIYLVDPTLAKKFYW